jgi:segregation and condensation protein A
VTIREKIGLITTTLKQAGKATFRKLLQRVGSRLEIVVTFLAMLELVKRHRVQATQPNLFGDISLEPAEDWDESDEFDLEFDD